MIEGVMSKLYEKLGEEVAEFLQKDGWTCSDVKMIQTLVNTMHYIKQIQHMDK